MKKSKLFSTISLILSGIVIAMSGLIIVHSATSQSVGSTLNVTYVANNVAFTASGYYQKETDNSTTNLVYSGDNNSSTTISFEPSNTSTTKNLQTPSNSAVTLSTTDTYVLFTYVFHNDASNDGYCIKVSLTDGSTKTNVTCKYLVSDTAYVSAELSTFISSVTGDSAPTDVYITAQSTKYFYILVSVPNLSLSSSYTSTAVSGLVWSVVNTDVTAEPAPLPEITISFVNMQGYCSRFEVWDSSNNPSYYPSGLGTKLLDGTSAMWNDTRQFSVTTSTGGIFVVCKAPGPMYSNEGTWTSTGLEQNWNYSYGNNEGWLGFWFDLTTSETHSLTITNMDWRE